MNKINGSGKRALAIFLSVTVFACGCTRTAPQAGVADKTLREEIRAGAEIDRTVRNQFYVYTEPGVNAYVTHVGERVARQASRRELTYRFTILYSDKIHATSAPGGFVYLTTGMLYFLQNEAELASVIAHEVAQLQQQNQKVSRLKQRDILRGASVVGLMAAPLLGVFGFVAVLGALLLQRVADPPRNTEQELIHCDRLALRLLADAGYDPRAFSELLHRMGGMPPEQFPYLQDYAAHRPVSEKRLEALRRNLSSLGSGARSVSSGPDPFLAATQPVRSLYRV